MGKKVEPHSKAELSIGSYYQFSVEGPEDLVEDMMTQFIDFVVANGFPIKVRDGERSVDSIEKDSSE